VRATELEQPDLARSTLAAWGAGHGDAFVARGDRGVALLRCAFDWSDLDER
jgi:hypothetical protein